MIRALCSLIIVIAIAGCGSGGNSLYGSLSEVYDLGYDTVSVSEIGSFIVIEYDLANGGKTAKLSVDLNGLVPTAGEMITLTDLVDNSPRGTLERIVDMTIELPIQTGTLVLNDALTVGQSVSGHFATTLSNPNGRTLDGDFKATLVKLQ